MNRKEEARMTAQPALHAPLAEVAIRTPVDLDNQHC